MLIVLNIALIAAMAAVVLVIVLGLTSMGGSNPHRSRKLMQWRIGFQLVAVLLAILIVVLNTR